MTTEFLKLPSSSHASGLGVRVERAPVVYSPSSTTEVNTSRLPSNAKLAHMKLAYRESFFSDEDLGRITIAKLNQIFWAALGIAIAVVVVGPLIPWSIAAPLVGGISFFLALNAVVRRTANPALIVMYLLGPGIALILIQFLGLVVAHRTIAAVAFGVATLILFYRIGKRPFVFYRAWLYTNPRLKPETRAEPKRIPLSPNLPLLAGLLAIVAVVPIFSPTIALAAVVGVCLFELRSDLNPLLFIRKLKTVFGQYLTYGMVSTDAPGVWMPEQNWMKRRMTVWSLCALLFTTLTTGLSLFAPWDVLRWKIEADYGEEVLAASYGSPFDWVFTVVQGLADAESAYLWVFPVALGLSIVVPYLVLAAVFKKPLGAAHRLHLEIEGDEANDIDPTVDVDKSRPEWEWYVDRMRTSDQDCDGQLGEHVREAEHLFLGIEPNAQFPVMLDKKILSEHCYMVGDTGSGKTALGIMPLLIQLLRGHRTPDGGTSEPPPIVVLDMKGDPALFHTLKAESEKRRKELGVTDPEDPRYAFRFFTPEKGRASHFFNPFQSLDTEARSDVQLCHLLLDSLSLNHGEGYGRSYYSRKSRMMLFDALTKGDRKPRSIEELYEKLKQFTRGSYDDEERLTGDFNYKHDTFELLATIHTLAKYEMLATTGNLDNPDLSIHMPEVIEQRQVVYFWLPAALESISVREIAKLGIFSLLTAAIDRQREKGTEADEPRQVYLVMDEFQRIAGENFKVILEQARSFGISAILANQTQSDLKTHDIDLRPTIRGNTRTKMFFSVTDPDEERGLSESSGQELAMLESGLGGFAGQAMGSASQWNQSIKPRLTRNDIMAVSDHPLEYILKVSRGAGFTQFAGLPLPVRTTYPLTEELYKQRQRMPWPELGKAMVTSDKSPKQREDEREREVAERTFGRLEEVIERMEA